MAPRSLIANWRDRREAALQQKPDDLPADYMPITQQDHDLILRYVLVGIFIIMATAALSITKTMALPLTGGLVFGMVLGPVVDRMVRAGLPQGLAAGLLVGAGTLLMSIALTIFAAPFALWSDRLPGMFAALRNRLSGLMQYVRQIETLTDGLKAQGKASIAVSEGGSPLIDIAIGSSTAAGGLLIFIATIYFYLATRRHMKARLLRLCLGRSARQSAGAFLENIEVKMASYFGVVTLINLGMGVIATVIAMFAGMPFPLFWGVVAFILNYIAFIGPLIMTVLMFGAGLVDDTTLLAAVWPPLTYFLAHLIEGNVVTPIAVGRRLTVSPFLVFISFIFWLWLWGPLGAILSTPILLVGTLAVEAAASWRKTTAADTAA